MPGADDNHSFILEARSAVLSHPTAHFNDRILVRKRTTPLHFRLCKVYVGICLRHVVGNYILRMVLDRESRWYYHHHYGIPKDGSSS